MKAIILIVVASLCGCTWSRDANEIDRINKICLKNDGLKKIEFMSNGTYVFCNDGANFHWFPSDFNKEQK